MKNSVSFLLGAGFSAPAGYPIANVLNNKILHCHEDVFSFNSDGRLMIRTDGRRPNLGYKTSYDFEFDFCSDLIQYFFKVRGYFDYEQFFDFFIDNAKTDKGVIDYFKHKIYGSEKKIDQLLFATIKIYNQIVNFYLRDRDGNRWYDDNSLDESSLKEYIGILNCLKKLEQKNCLNIHTLNHDLFFERFNKSEWIKDKICDGFELSDSPYFGDSYLNNEKSGIAYYNGIYKSNVRLFKLHGSRDYAVYSGQSNGLIFTPEVYVKVPYGIGISNLYKKISDSEGGERFEHCWINYHADFLTGTTSKIRRYDEPLFYQQLFEHFINNLKGADKLIIIGYGGKDTEINKILLENFDYKNKSSFIIDPFPGDSVRLLKEQLNAKLINKKLENIHFEDLN